MADSLNITNLSRRSMLGTGIAAAGALAGFGPLPLRAAETDAEIVRLYASYRDACERDTAAYAAWDIARAKAVKALRKILSRKGGDLWPPRYDQVEEWEAAVSKQAEAMGFAPLQQATEMAMEARHEAWQALADTPAQSVTGVALKLVALFQWDDALQEAWSGNGDSELGTIMCLAARADALRLAGLPHTLGTVEV